MTLSLSRVLLFVALLGPGLAGADDQASFRAANEDAARGRYDAALAGYARLEASAVAAPSLYWNWAQAALGAGRKGEALWAFLTARQLVPGDGAPGREIEKLRAELGLDPSEISLGLEGDARLAARRLRFDLIALVILAASLALAFLPRGRPAAAGVLLALAIFLLGPYHFAAWRQVRGVIVQKDAPLMDAARDDAVALANLREGEVVPILGEEGEFVRIQDASGARGFARRADVRTLRVR